MPLCLILALMLSPMAARAELSYASLDQVGLGEAVYDEGLALLLIRASVDAYGYREERMNAAGFCHDTLRAAGVEQLQDVAGFTATEDDRPTAGEIGEDERFERDAIVSSIRLGLRVLADNGISSLLINAAGLVKGADYAGAARKIVNLAASQLESTPCATVGLTRNGAGEPVVVVAFEGTGNIAGWLMDAVTFAAGGMHLGFMTQGRLFILNAGDALRFDLGGGETDSLNELIERAASGERIHFLLTGHSLGGALAQVLAVRLWESGVPEEQIGGYSFASPTVYTEDFWTERGIDPEDFRFYNRINTLDPVPHLGVTNRFLLDSALDGLLYLLGMDLPSTQGVSFSGVDLGQSRSFTASAADLGFPDKKGLGSNHIENLYEEQMRREYNALNPDAPVAKRLPCTMDYSLSSLLELSSINLSR